MTILRERQVRKREVVKRAQERLDWLTPEQAARVRAALRVLRIRLGGGQPLAKALGVRLQTVERLCSAKGKPPGAGAAIRAAALAGVPVEDVLSGAWPKAGSCPLCGRV